MSDDCVGTAVIVEPCRVSVALSFQLALRNIGRILNIVVVDRVQEVLVKFDNCFRRECCISGEFLIVFLLFMVDLIRKGQLISTVIISSITYTLDREVGIGGSQGATNGAIVNTEGTRNLQSSFSHSVHRIILGIWLIPRSIERSVFLTGEFSISMNLVASLCSYNHKTGNEHDEC